MLWDKLARQLLFQLPAEKAHHVSMGLFDTLLSPRWVASGFASRLTVDDHRLQTQAFGLEFRNPIGLAAGFDKDAKWFSRLSALGFGHVEIGTVTGQGQTGNPQPRLFRLPHDQAILNRMGFNNDGADAVAQRLAKSSRFRDDDILGINIGKTKVVPVESAVDDYLFSFERLYLYGDYFTVNVSSPNTPGLRELQNREPLIELLSRLQEKNRQLAVDHEIAPKPILLKIAPDVTDGQLNDVVEILQQIRLDGIIATNTTLSRDGLTTDASKVAAMGAGGVSGRPLTIRSRQVVATIFQQLQGTIPIVGVGGILTGEDAWQMLSAGASLCQIYTGFVYGGPTIVRDINRYLLKKLTEHQWDHISQAVGHNAAALSAN